MTFDLGDATKWEFFFPNVEQPLLVVPEDSSATLEGTEAKVSGHQSQPLTSGSTACMHTLQQDVKEDFELPPSWVLPINISRKGMLRSEI